MTQPQPTATFQVNSGAVCFGAKNNIRYGAHQPIQSPQPVAFQPGGTVLFHSYEYNLAACNGTWHAYALIVKDSQSSSSSPERRSITAWFACHERLSSNPHQEAQRILQVANSPYEEDNATNRNTEQTWEGRVLVINRYDWMYYDKRNHPEPNGEAENECGDFVSLVDYEHARTHHSREWCQNQGGVQLNIDGEYSFGRFGLTEDRSRVHSFLYFSATTPLSQAVFCTAEEEESRDCVPIYIPLTEEERHSTRIADGTYTGFQFLRNIKTVPPADSPLLGPFQQTLFDDACLVSILQESSPHCSVIEPQLKNDVLLLLNEMMSCWVTVLAKTADHCGSKEDFVQQAFPQREIQPSVDSYLVKRMQQLPQRNTQEEEAVEAVPSPPPPSMRVDQQALKGLVSSVSATSSLWTYCTVEQMAHGMRYLLGEILELAGNCARDGRRRVLVPSDVRMAVANDAQLVKKFARTKVFYPPEMGNDASGEASS